MCLQKARISLPCSACIGQINDAMHRAISRVTQEVFSPLGNQLITEETSKKLAQCIMAGGCLSRASCADHLAKYWLDAKISDQGREVLDSAVLWSL